MSQQHLFRQYRTAILSIVFLTLCAALLLWPRARMFELAALAQESAAEHVVSCEFTTGVQAQPDGLSPEQQARVERAEAEYFKSQPRAPQPSVTGPIPFNFYPQAGAVWQDIPIGNYFDLDTGPGMLDWDCTHYTYNGHDGHDSGLRSFREQDLGVPVYAALDGTVIDAHDGEADRNVVAENQPANYVLIDHGETQVTYYYHLKKGSVAVARGQQVKAGTQIGLTGSSGNSTGPHLHFASKYAGVMYEPYAGPCRAGASNWVLQPPKRRDTYIHGFLFSSSALSGNASLDNSVRTGTFLLNTELEWMRIDFANLPANSLHNFKYVRPDGSTAAEWAWQSQNTDMATAVYYWATAVKLNAVGHWHLLFGINGTQLYDAEFDVVASQSEVVNRPPRAVTTVFDPAAPKDNDVLFCRVQSPVVGDDPDYDLVGYRFRWSVNGVPVRDVTNAALGDAIPKGMARAGDTVTCVVTPTDGNAVGPSTTSSVQLAASAAPTLQLNSSTLTADEGGSAMTVVVSRLGDASAPVAVAYATEDGTATYRTDYVMISGVLNFAPGETSKILTLLTVDDRFAEGPETFTLKLSDPSGASLGSPSTATLTILDNDALNGVSPVVWNANFDAAFFVRQQYLDFLNREPDAPGFAFWQSQITSCGSDMLCAEVRRINVSAAFFLSIEFQETGYFVYRTYKAAYGDSTSPNVTGTVPVIRFQEFMPDTQSIAHGVVVGQGNWQQQIEDNKSAFCTEFVTRARFANAYPATLTAAQFVEKLNQSAGGVLSDEERSQLTAELAASPADAGKRASVLRKVAEDPDLRRNEYNRAFVLMEYYGYLRRNPDDPQDMNFSGWAFWIDKLNRYDGNFVKAEMVKAFLLSDEYVHRFGTR